METNQFEHPPKQRKGLGFVIAGLVLCIVGVLGLAGMVVTIVGMAGAFERYVFPGEHMITFDEPGRYSIAYEHQSVINGRTFSTPEQLPAADYRLVSVASGQDVPLHPTTSTVTYAAGGHEGKAIFGFTIATPGEYRLGAEYTDGAEQPQFVLAVSHGSLGGAIGMALLYGCGGMPLGLAGVVLLIIGIVQLVRSR